MYVFNRMRTATWSHGALLCHLATCGGRYPTDVFRAENVGDTSAIFRLGRDVSPRKPVCDSQVILRRTTPVNETWSTGHVVHVVIKPKPLFNKLYSTDTASQNVAFAFCTVTGPRTAFAPAQSTTSRTVYFRSRSIRY